MNKMKSLQHIVYIVMFVIGVNIARAENNKNITYVYNDNGGYITTDLPDTKVYNTQEIFSYFFLPKEMNWLGLHHTLTEDKRQKVIKCVQEKHGIKYHIIYLSAYIRYMIECDILNYSREANIIKNHRESIRNHSKIIQNSNNTYNHTYSGFHNLIDIYEKYKLISIKEHPRYKRLYKEIMNKFNTYTKRIEKKLGPRDARIKLIDIVYIKDNNRAKYIHHGKQAVLVVGERSMNNALGQYKWYKELYATIYHETVHHVLNYPGERINTNLEEGIAVYLENKNISTSQAFFGWQAYKKAYKTIKKYKGKNVVLAVKILRSKGKKVSELEAHHLINHIPNMDFNDALYLTKDFNDNINTNKDKDYKGWTNN